MAQLRSRKQGAARSSAPKRHATAGRERFVALARDGLASLVAAEQALRRHLDPIDALDAQYRPRYEPDAHLVEYARAHGTAYLEVSRNVGTAVRDGALDLAGGHLGGWRDAYADWFVARKLRVYVADRAGSSADPALRYRLEWTDQKPPLNEWDQGAHASRWRDQHAIASRTEGTCIVRSATNGDQTDVQAGIGVLFQPTRSKGLFEFRALALWTSWLSLSADAPPIAPPHPVATARSYGAVRLVAQSWRAADASDFRTDAVRDLQQWDYAVGTPDRLWAHSESGIAAVGAAAWINLPADRERIYALWVILRCYSHSRYAPPSLSSAIVTAKCTVPFIFVEH